MITDIRTDPRGLTGKRLNLLRVEPLGVPTVAIAAASDADIHTSGGHATYSSAGAQTQPSAPRNVYAEVSVASTVAWVDAAGAFTVGGLDIEGNSIIETFGIEDLVDAAATGILGSRCFASISLISRGAIVLSSTAHAQSNAISYYLGGGPSLPLPGHVKRSDFVKHCRVGTSPVAITGTLFSSGYTPGQGSTAAIIASGGTYATDKPVLAWFKQL